MWIPRQIKMGVTLPRRHQLLGSVRLVFPPNAVRHTRGEFVKSLGDSEIGIRMALHYSLYDLSDDEGDQGRILSEDEEPQAIEEIVEGEVEPFNDEAAAGDDLDDLFGDSNTPATDAEKKEVKEKKTRKASQVPKLNTERLKGPGGIIAIDELFKDFKMQGRGHEIEDLEQILKRFKNWTHRMYPRFSFPDCVEQIERLGTKTDIKNFMLRNRNQTILADVAPMQLFDDENDAVDDPAPITAANIPSPREWGSEDENSPPPSPPPVLAAELLERMRLSREAALKRRMDKMLEQQAKDASLPRDETPAAAEPIAAQDMSNEDSTHEESTQLETPMEVDQAADENLDVVNPDASQAVDTTDSSPS